MATAKKLPSGSWRVNLYVGTDSNGKRKYKSFTADTKKEAEYLAAEYNLKRKEKSSDLTFQKAVQNYINSKRNVLSPTTISSYDSLARNHYSTINNIPLSKLTQYNVQVEINHLAGQGLSPKTIRSAHGLISATLAMFMPEFRLNTKLPQKQRKFKELPQPKIIIDTFKGSEIEIPVLLALWCGLRMSEILGIRKEDIKGNVLTINRVAVIVDRELIIKETAKTYNSNRRIVLPDILVNLISNVETDTVVTLSRNVIYKRYVKVVKALGYTMTFHDLRHLNASVMLQLGIPDKYAMERGGWSTPSIMKSVYQHTFSDERKTVDNKIDTYFNSLYADKA